MARKKKREVRKDNELGSFYDILSRYFAIFLVSLGNLWIFYFLFTPLTFYASAYILGLFYEVSAINQFIFVKQAVIEISKACVAGSAYYLLFMLDFSTRGIKLGKRLLVLIFTSFLLFALNIIRIIILALVKVNNIGFFDQLHAIFWYFVSVIYVFIVWVIASKVFKIEEVPFYSDFLYIKKLGGKKKVNSKKK